MPAAIAVPAIASVIAGGTAAGATIYGSRKAGQSARRASEIQSKSDDAALQFERERDAEAKRQWEAQQQFEQQKYAAQEEQRLHDRALADQAEARRAPYRAASQAALQSLAQRLGLHFDMPASAPNGPPMGAPTMPPASRPLMQSPAFGGAPTSGPMASPYVQGGPMNEPYGAGSSPQLSYDPNNPMTAGQLLKLQPRRLR